MIADETVERVRAAADIVAIISEFVPLRRLGSDHRGACPFHGGTNPNFSVSQKRGSYHCFVCHESGDVFMFVRKRLGLDFPSAVRMIGERVGIDVVDTPTRAHAPDPNERHWETLSTAAEWFREQLGSPAGAAAREYLHSRELDEAAWARFGIGFAPRDGQVLRRYLHSLGFDDTRQTDAGLLVLREGETEPRVRFRGRVMFTILDEAGHHVGFGGRALGDHAPKYLNSPESAVFQKRRTLYGLNTARQAMRRNERAIVVEGYVDAIRLALAGVEEAVAPLGTALTEEQAALLVRYASEIFLVYDSDEAGQKATFRSGLELLRHKAAVRVVSLPDDQDPDTFVQAHGRAGFDRAIADAIDLFDRQIQMLDRLGWFADLRRTRRAVDRLLPTIRAARDPLTRDLYLARLSEASRLDKATIAAEVDDVSSGSRSRHAPSGGGRSHEPDAPPPEHDEAPYAGGGYPGPPPDVQDTPGPSPYAAAAQQRTWKGKRGRNAGPEWRSSSVPPRPRRDEPAERALIRAMLLERDIVERVAERHGPEDFRDPSYRAIFAALLAAAPDDDLERMAECLESAPLERLRELVDGLDADNPGATDVSASLARLDARPLEARRDEILRLMALATREQSDLLMRERMELEEELRRLLPIRSPRGKPRA